MKMLTLAITLILSSASFAKSNLSSKLEGTQWKLVEQIVGEPGKEPRFTRLPDEFPEKGYFYEIFELLGGTRNYFPNQINFMSNSKVTYMPASIDLDYSINDAEKEISITDEFEEYGDKSKKETLYKVKIYGLGKKMKLTQDIGDGESSIYKFELLNP